MTICISAFSAEAIVCIADKMVSIGDYSQWDADVTKIISLFGSGNTNVLVAGSLCECQAVIEGLSAKAKPSDDYLSLSANLETVYSDNYLHRQDMVVLGKRGLSRSTYEQAIGSGSSSFVSQRLLDEMERFDFDCDMMLCGISDAGDKYTQFIVSVSQPAIIRYWSIQGFNSIGIGADIANSRMLWSGYKRTHCIGRVIFDVFDAKANAELSQGVGFTWDARVIYPSAVYDVPDNVKELIEGAWDEHNRSPFEKWNRKDYAQRPPRGWKDKILKLSQSDLSLVR